MSKTSVITARLDPETMALVDKVAKSHGRSRAWFAAYAIQRIAESEADFMAFVQVGIDAADRGDLIPQDEVFERVRARREARDAA